MTAGRLEGRTAIVTGASRGIGAAIAKRLATEGATVAVAARTREQTDERLPGTIDSVVAEIEAGGGRALAVEADLAKPDDRARIVETVVADLGPPDILVNNAAVTYFLPTADFPRKRVDLMFEVQVHATMDLAQRVLPHMIEAGRGSILNISSKAALHPHGHGSAKGGGGVASGAGDISLPFNPRVAFATVYGMCKAAIERFSTGLAAEVYERGIAVNALSPTQVVPTPGVLFHGLVDPATQPHEPVEVMAEAGLELVARGTDLTGRICFSQELLDELHIPIPGSSHPPKRVEVS